MTVRASESLVIASPAKLNLFLHVLGRREDGLHELQTLFQLLDYGDSLRLRRRRAAGVGLRCYGAHVPAADNLVCRAAELLAAHCRIKAGVDIELYKRVPVGSGLGGGSSNAASTLHGLNGLWQCGLTVAELASLGVALGADVPVFVYGRSAWGEGIGDQLQPVALPQHWYVVLVPTSQIATGKIYARLRLTHYQLPITIDDYRHGGASNVFESVVVREYPEVQRLMEWLAAYAPPKLSGTGGAVFAAFADHQTARAVFANKPQQVEGFLCQGIVHAPWLKANTVVH